MQVREAGMANATVDYILKAFTNVKNVNFDFHVSVVSACLETYDRDEPNFTSRFGDITQTVDDICNRS